MSNIVFVKPTDSSYVITYQEAAGSTFRPIRQDTDQLILEAVSSYLKDAVKRFRQKRQELFAE